MIGNEDLLELAQIYNKDGKKELFNQIRNKYEIKNASALFSRMKKNKTLNYDIQKNRFCLETEEIGENLFLSLEDLCPSFPVNKSAVSATNNAAMEKMVKELIEDRLLELSKYVTINSFSKQIVIDKTSMITDGYRVMIN